VTPAVWFPAVRCGTGTDVFTERLTEGLSAHDIPCEVTWLPHRAEYAPWSVPVPKPPPWADVVHINSWLHPRFLPKDLPLVVTVHHSVHDPILGPYKSFSQTLYHDHWIRPIEAENIRRANRVTAVSRYTAQQIEKSFACHQVTVIHNGIDTENIFTPGPPRRHPHHPFRLLYVGNWMPRKGVDLLAPILTRLGLDFELWYTTGHSGTQNASQLPENSRCLGRLNTQDLIRAYRETDALLFPSRYEGFGLVAAEAMACGLPVIASHTSSLPEIIEDGVTGFLCPLNEASAFAQAARLLQENPRRWQAIGQKARKKAHQIFAMPHMIRKYISIYKSTTN